MGDAIGAVLPLAVGVAVSPIPIIAVVLMLATPSGRGNGVAFVVGWVAGLAAAGTIVLLVSGAAGASDDGDAATWVGVVELVLGIALVVLAGLQWYRRPRTGEAALPGWMTAIDTFTAVKAAGLGVVLSAVNPKNLLLTVGAAAAIAQTGADGGGQAVALAVFVLVGTLGPGIPLGIYFGLGSRSQQMLEGLRGWMARNNTAIMCVLLAVIGVKLIADGISAMGG